MVGDAAKLPFTGDHVVCLGHHPGRLERTCIPRSAENCSNPGPGQWGTKSSNPSPSTGESSANLTSDLPFPRFRPYLGALLGVGKVFSF